MENDQSPIVGHWRITKMELWDREAIDSAGPAYIQFDARGGGELSFICVQGGLDCLYGISGDESLVEFTWRGANEMEPVSGHGWALLKGKDKLLGKIYFHESGEASRFRARRRKTAVPH